MSTAALTLGIDTSSRVTSAALLRGRDVVGRFSHDDPMAHGEVLAPAIEELLRAAGATPRDLRTVVVGVGPGPFTGLRVGMVTAEVLAHAVGARVVGVCSLDALALQSHAAPGAYVVSGSDARRREVYVAGYDASGRRLWGPEVLAPSAALARALADRPDVPMVAVGAGLAAHPDLFPGACALTPDAAVLAAGVLDGRLEAAAVRPLYLRQPDAVAAASPGKPVTP